MRSKSLALGFQQEHDTESATNCHRSSETDEVYDIRILGWLGDGRKLFGELLERFIGHYPPGDQYEERDPASKCEHGAGPAESLFKVSLFGPQPGGAQPCSHHRYAEAEKADYAVCVRDSIPSRADQRQHEPAGE